MTNKELAHDQQVKHTTGTSASSSVAAISSSVTTKHISVSYCCTAFWQLCTAYVVQLAHFFGVT